MTQHSQQASTPWGLWATLGFSLVIFLAFLVVQTVAIAGYAYYLIQQQPHTSLAELMPSLATNGLGISLSLIPGAAAGSLLVILFAWLRENISVKQYLYMYWPGFKKIMLWVGLLILFAIGMEVVNQYTERPMPSWMVDSYKTAGVLPLFWFTLVIAAPIFEELLFRGFLFEGLRYSRIGNLGAIIITSALWASIHLQYELFEVVSIFLIGLLFGYAKIKTGSLYTSIIMHALMNLAATVQVALLVNQQ